ncbi:MAG: hydrogenase nickel incorporation protein HypB [Thermoplasmata archaeon]|nr:MAG: hydrogenase nickel incorporation protein HypB [Thermoplasmata archaeon]
MHKTVDVSVEQNLFEANNEIAAKNAELLKGNNIFSIDFLGSIGSGKTLLIEKILDVLNEKGIKGAAIAGDVAGDDDYKRIIEHGVQAVSLNTGKECHLDAHLISHSLEDMDLGKIDVLFIENIGNLVCPMDFPLGTDKRVVVISVTEGDDMVRKHPAIFGLADIVVINKIDLADIMEVDIERIKSDAKSVNPHCTICLTDAKHNDGIEELISALDIQA